MSTATMNATSLFKLIFPESDWTEIKPEEYEQVFQALMAAGNMNASAAQFMKRANIKLGLHQQYKSGAGWTFLGNITLAPDAKVLDPYTLCLISHEIIHIQQPLLARLSVRGEMLAWQFQIKAYRELTGNEIGDQGQAYGGRKNYFGQNTEPFTHFTDYPFDSQAVIKKITPADRSDW